MLQLCKTALVASATLLMAATAAVAQVQDFLGIPGSITLGGKAYSLARSSQPQPNYTKQEYLPAGQTLPAYQQMILVERVQGGIGVMDAVKAQVDALNKRKGSDPLLNMDVVENKAAGEVLLDFIVSSKDAKGEFTVEWNAYRYARLKADSGVILLGVSHRAYGNNDAKTFLTGLKAVRATTIKALIEAPLPEPTK